MNEPWRRICAGCRHINAQEPKLHCYMFKDAPETSCAQNTFTMDEAKRKGKTIRLDQLSEVVLETLK